MITELVGGFNQLEKWWSESQWVSDDIPYMKWNIISPCSKPPTSFFFKWNQFWDTRDTDSSLEHSWSLQMWWCHDHVTYRTAQPPARKWLYSLNQPKMRDNTSNPQISIEQLDHLTFESWASAVIGCDNRMKPWWRIEHKQIWIYIVPLKERSNLDTISFKWRVPISMWIFHPSKFGRKSNNIYKQTQKKPMEKRISDSTAIYHISILPTLKKCSLKPSEPTNNILLHTYGLYISQNSVLSRYPKKQPVGPTQCLAPRFSCGGQRVGAAVGFSDLNHSLGMSWSRKKNMLCESYLRFML